MPLIGDRDILAQISLVQQCGVVSICRRRNAARRFPVVSSAKCVAVCFGSRLSSARALLASALRCHARQPAPSRFNKFGGEKWREIRRCHSYRVAGRRRARALAARPPLLDIGQSII